MAFRAIWSQDMIYRLGAIAVLLAIPVFTVLAWRGWAKRVRKELPRWRSVIGVISILITFLSWLAFVGPFLLMGLDSHTVNNLNFDIWLSVILLMLFIGISLALALRGTSRVQTLLAGLLMVALWFASIVH